MQRVYDFLKQCKTYYLATVEADQPRVRPFGTINLYEGRLYLLTGKSKSVSRQLAVNPKVEICAVSGDRWIRIQATAVEDERVEAKKSMLEAYRQLRDRYSETDDNTQVFYLKNGTAILYETGGEKRIISF